MKKAVKVRDFRIKDMFYGKCENLLVFESIISKSEKIYFVQNWLKREGFSRAFY